METVAIRLKQLTSQLVLLGCFGRNSGQTRKVLIEANLVVVIDIKHTKNSVEKGRIAEKHARLELPKECRSKKVILFTIS